MSNFRKLPLLGAGILTPALSGQPQAAEARSIDFTSAAQTAVTARPAEKALFYQDVFTLRPAEKLRIAGDRIRLSEAKSKTVIPSSALPRSTVSDVKVKSGVQSLGPKAGARLSHTICPSKKTHRASC